MGGGNKQQGSTTQTQETKSDPWSPTRPLLESLISKYGNISTDVTPEQKAAIEQLKTSTGNIPNFGDPSAGALDKAFNFSTQPQIGMLNEAYGDLKGRLGATADGQYLDPYKTPGFADAIATMGNDITNSVKATYAASGRDPSGAGSFAGSLGRGMAKGLAPTIAAQANTNFGNMVDAAKTLYGAGGTTASGASTLGAQEIAAGMGGISAAPAVTTAYTNPAQASLQAAQASYALPWSNLGMLQSPLVQLAGLGGSSSGTSQATSYQPQSTASNIMGGVLGAASLWPTLMGSGAGSAGAAGLLPSLFALSDERMKDDVEPIGRLNDGQNIYRFRYKGDPKTHIGLLAQETEHFDPSAVAETSEGIKMVNLKTATDRAAEMSRAA